MQHGPHLMARFQALLAFKLGLRAEKLGNGLIKIKKIICCGSKLTLNMH